MEYIEYGLACDDCVHAIASDDYSALSDDTENAVRKGLERTGHYLVVGDEAGFSHQGCDVCGSRLGGNRHQVGYLE